MDYSIVVKPPLALIGHLSVSGREHLKVVWAQYIAAQSVIRRRQSSVSSFTPNESCFDSEINNPSTPARGDDPARAGAMRPFDFARLRRRFGI